jgi:hypothetical protein
MLIRNFTEYYATRPYLARLVTVESAAVTDRPESSNWRVIWMRRWLR